MGVRRIYGVGTDLEYEDDSERTEESDLRQRRGQGLLAECDT